MENKFSEERNWIRGGQSRYVEEMDEAIPRVNVLGVGVSAVNMAQAVSIILNAAGEGERGYVSFLTVHGVMEAQRSEALKTAYNQTLLCNPDGMPLSWLGWQRGYTEMDRVYGPDFMLAIFERTRKTTFRHFLYGGKPGVAESLKSSLEKRFEGVTICGTYTPPFRALNDGEWKDLIRQIDECRPHFLWVGISTPKQEFFMVEAMARSLNCQVLLGVGAAFDFHAGLVSQAPPWIQRAGLEWFYRLCTEPKRLWKRYLVNNPLFLWRVALQLTGLKKYPVGEKSDCET